MDLFVTDNGASVPVEYVKRKRQKNIRIRIKADRVVVSAPYWCNRGQMETFLKSQKAWVDKSIGRMAQKKRATDEKNRFSEGELLLRGVWMPLYPDHSGRIRSVQETGAALFYPGHLKPGTSEFNTAIMQFYRKAALTEIPARLDEIAEQHGFTYHRVFIRSQKTKWGTCSTKGNLSFNWRLIKCPPEIWDYLFIHELSHMVHFNHSPAFWREVGRHFPGWKKAERWLKENSSLLFLEP